MKYRFDDFLLDPATRELHRRGEQVVLPARAFDCLAYLVEHRERAVGRDELIAAVWGRVEVSDALLGHTIVKIRRGLGDTGNEQRTIRTVPRFGYRWVMALDPLPADGDVDSPVERPSTTSMPASGDAIDTTPVASHRTRWMIAFALAAVALVALAIWRNHPVLPPPEQATVVEKDDPTTSAVAALVLPADVSAPEDWQWLRLGMMDLIANRLRAGAVVTAPSESVVSLLRQRGGKGDELLHDAALAQVASLRVQPRVTLAQGRWNVRLDAFGSQRSLSVEAQADDAISAARQAADALLRKLGHEPNVVAVENTSPALDELLQRSGAAMLADQLEQARTLIASAPPELQQQPQIVQRMAQIELRAGDYEAVETRLHALLDRLASGHDVALRARAMMTLAAAYVRGQQSDKALELYDEAIALRQSANDHEVLGVARLGRGAVLAQQGHYDDATAELSRARIELATVGDSLGVASVDVNLGEFQRMRRRPADALPLLKNAVRQFERLGAREGRAYALAQQVMAERELLEVDAALATSERYWPPEAHTNNQRMRWVLTEERAATLIAVGRITDAENLIARIRNESDPRRDALVRAQTALLAAGIAQHRADVAGALSQLDAALLPVLRDGDPFGWGQGLALQARLLRDDHRLPEAATATETLRAWAAGSADEWRSLQATLALSEQAWAEHRREPALEQFARAMQSAGRLGVPEDLVAVGAPYLAALIDASQLDTARAVSGRIALWAERDARAATAQARLFRALRQDDAARTAEETAARLLAGYDVAVAPH